MLKMSRGIFLFALKVFNYAWLIDYLSFYLISNNVIKIEYFTFTSTSKYFKSYAYNKQNMRRSLNTNCSSNV